MPGPPFPRGSGGCVLYPGTRVMLHGLKGEAARYNSTEGSCAYWDKTSRRMDVRLDSGEVHALRPIVLRKVVVREEVDPEDDPQYSKVVAVFRQFDANGDGVMDRQEFATCLKSLGLGPSCVDRYLRSVDKDGDQEVQYEEFVRWAMAPASQATKTSRVDVYWPDRRGSGTVEAVFTAALDGDGGGVDDDEPAPDEEMTLEDVERLCGQVPAGWPSHALTVLNNMRRRFPEYPVAGIIWRMRRNDFIGGKVTAAIRATGAKEVEMVPPSAVRVGHPDAFPSQYRVRSLAKGLSVYRQEGSDFSFARMRDRKLQAVEEIPPGGRFRLLEVRRGNEYGFCFGRVSPSAAEATSSAHYWVVLGMECSRSHFTCADEGRTSQDLHYSEAARLDS